MEFIRENTDIKIIPSSIRGISSGKIASVKEDFFVVKISNFNSQYFQKDAGCEVIIADAASLITFNAVIKSVGTESIEFLKPSKYRTIQRREYARIDLNIPVKIRDITSSDPDEEESISKNISGGGLQILTSQDFYKGAKLEAKFKIFDDKSVDTILEVLRVNNESSGQYSISGRFIKISNRDRTEIIQLCFKKQLERSCKNIKMEG